MLVLVGLMAVAGLVVGGEGALQILDTWIPFTRSDPSWGEGCVACLDVQA